MEIKGEIEINFNSDREDDYFEIVSFEEENEFGIYIYTKKQRKYCDLVNDKQLFSDMIYQFNVNNELCGECNTNNKVDTYINENPEEILKFLQEAKEIHLLGSLEEVKMFVDRNRFPIDTRIIWNNKQPFTKERVALLKNTFGRDNNIFYMIEGNMHYIDIESFSQTVNYIDSIVDHVKSLNFSTLEEDMYVFDLVRDRVYKEEDSVEEKYISRDLTSIIFGDKIVCGGFSVLFNTILTKLGHNIMPFRLEGQTELLAHSRSLEYVEDKKYYVEGLFFFDTTFGCKKSNESNDFLNSYKYFAKTFKMFERFDRGTLRCKTYEYFEDRSIDDVEKKLENENYIFNLLNLIKFEDINRMLSFIGEEQIDYAKKIESEELIEKLFFISMLASYSINSKTFLQILYNVRKQQYYENPEKYLFDMNVITEILTKSYVTDSEIDSVSRLIAILGGAETIVNENNATDRVLDFMNKDDRKLDMARVKLTRTLKSIVDKKDTMKK